MPHLCLPTREVEVKRKRKKNCRIDQYCKISDISYETVIYDNNYCQMSANKYLHFRRIFY